jgi:hypothetical protein
VDFIPSGSSYRTTVRGSAVGAKLAKGLEYLASLTKADSALESLELKI